ncbi:PIN domain-containing protein [Georgenia sp. TF02-10]|uniref:PIN domain-containing protein n=1 Tax=Georgenia sp. TF02-10 TaxID=2917725 RepID=UPI001FA6C7D5|nr:PIN domain-containing protein [Georgenia sp. TF02-10]UNX55653.1 PIN domain-containing protein [Georgenia sp. TF02-10]
MDTDVFSHVYVWVSSTDRRVPGWRKLLTGTRVVISFQTRTELLAGALANSWGRRRLSELRAVLDRTPTIRADDEVIDAHATLFAECRRRGHALQDKQHTADRWIAASAIAKGIALLAGDGIYQDAPGLTVLT